MRLPDPSVNRIFGARTHCVPWSPPSPNFMPDFLSQQLNVVARMVSYVRNRVPMSQQVRELDFARAGRCKKCVER